MSDLKIEAQEPSAEDVMKESLAVLITALQASMPFMTAKDMLPFLKAGYDWTYLKMTEYGPDTPIELVEFNQDLAQIVNQFFPANAAVVVIADEPDHR